MAIIQFDAVDDKCDDSGECQIYSLFVSCRSCRGSAVWRSRVGGPDVNAFHNKTCIRTAMESVIEIAGGAPSGLGRSLLGSDLALGIGSIPLV